MMYLTRYKFPAKCTNDYNFELKDQKGQTLIEFLLLLVSLVAIAFTFMRVVNGNLAEQWTGMSQVILEDPTQTLQVR